ncbi:hypothetical protein [Acidithiobacillus thiooxidans]|uniref:hypothetical protein n=1 Tax=Acidithiobacillus thiooxidans TaxID=930 RepID=UPI003564CB65
MNIWEDPVVQSGILDYLEQKQLLASFTSMGGVALREGAQCHCSLPEHVGNEVIVLCQFDFEELVPFGAAGDQRLRQQGQAHVRLDANGQVSDAWLCRPGSC